VHIWNDFILFYFVFYLFHRPTNILCGIQLFLTGFVFTIVYAALLTKTNRIARIFQAGRKSAKRPNFISPKSQLVICAGICSLQVKSLDKILGNIYYTVESFIHSLILIGERLKNLQAGKK
jgi:hypothetical protein